MFVRDRDLNKVLFWTLVIVAILAVSITVTLIDPRTYSKKRPGLT
jgi:hypothetical protein